MLKPQRLSSIDLLRVGGTGLRTRPLRAVLSALGIAIGIAAMIAVVGISSSSRAELDQTLNSLGTNLLMVEPGNDFTGKKSPLPKESVPMVKRIAPVTAVSSVGLIPKTRVYRNEHIPKAETSGIGVYAADLDLLKTVSGTIARGEALTTSSAEFPAVVLGSIAAKNLGISGPNAPVVVLIGGEWFSVIGVLEPVPLAPELDMAALVGRDIAIKLWNWDEKPTRIYTRVVESHIEDVRKVLASTANPSAPQNEGMVSRPSDALAAKQATDAAFTGLLVGLGSVALLVGGIGVANTMVISVLERRGEIGLRRSLGATRGNIRSQFLVESLLLSALGGIAGVIIGFGITAIYSRMQGWPTSLPAPMIAAGVGATLVIGALAGLYPAFRAARLAPTEALGSN